MDETLTLRELEQVIAEALAAVPWSLRLQSQGRSGATHRVAVASLETGEMMFALFDAADQQLDRVQFADLDTLRVEPRRAIAYAGSVSHAVAGAASTTPFSELVPHPALLALPELTTAEDFVRANDDASLIDRACERLTRAKHPGPPPPADHSWASLWQWMVVDNAAPEEVARLVRDEPSTLQVRGEFGHTLVHELANAPNAELLSLLLEAGAEVNARTSDGHTPLHVCRLETAPLLLQAGAELEARAEDGATPLVTLASEPGTERLLELLLEHGADANARDAAGMSALDIARERGESKKVRVLERA